MAAAEAEAMVITEVALEGKAVQAAGERPEMREALQIRLQV
jgi:hypothetical protein